jgi:hypothetical protein
MDNREGRFHLVISGLKLVACEFEDQMKSLPSFVCHEDEVANTYSDGCLLVPQLIREGIIPTELQAAFDSLDQHFTDMPKSKLVWSLEGLETQPEWQSAREMARSILGKLNIELGLPNFDGINYVPSK